MDLQAGVCASTTFENAEIPIRIATSLMRVSNNIRSTAAYRLKSWPVIVCKPVSLITKSAVVSPVISAWITVWLLVVS